MQLGAMKSLARTMVPQAKPTAIPEGDLTTILNEGVLDICQRLLCVKANGKFNRTLDVAEYSLSTVLTRYLVMDLAGVWWSDAGTWKRLEPATIEWMDLNIPTWRNTASGTPIKFFVRGDTLTIYPASTVTLASGLWAYFVQKSPAMSDDAHYPFAINSPPTTEQADLAILSSTVLLYWEWQALRILGKIEESKAKYLEYLAELEAKRTMLKKMGYIYGETA